MSTKLTMMTILLLSPTFVAILRFMNIEVKNNGRRGSEELWLDAAYKVLVRSGVDAVKVMPLAKSLNMSRTSFYWHFDDREALLDALIKRWQEKNTTNLVDRTEAYAETITEAMFNLFDCWIDTKLFDAGLDISIRNWAQQSPTLKKLLAQTDRDRITAICAMFARFGFDDNQADVRAHTVYYTQIGYISMMVDEPVRHRIKKMPDYVESYTGIFPSTSEIDRFQSRHLK